MDKRARIIQLIDRLDSQLELLEEHGGQIQRYAKLSYRLEIAQRRLYKLGGQRGHIVMANVLVGPNVLRLVYGTAEKVMAAVVAGKAK